jgi:endonuclease YncB( thermonuclease family)
MTALRTLAMTSRAYARMATLAIFSVLLLLSACAPRGPLFMEARPEGPPPPTIAAQQSDVLIVNGEAIRLADAVTPQPSPDARCAAEALAARQAALELKNLVHGVRTVSVTPTGAKDDLNRPYAHVLLDGEDPAHDLIEEGLAVAPSGQRFDWCGPISASFPRARHIATLSFSGT